MSSQPSEPENTSPPPPPAAAAPILQPLSSPGDDLAEKEEELRQEEGRLPPDSSSSSSSGGGNDVSVPDIEPGPGPGSRLGEPEAEAGGTRAGAGQQRGPSARDDVAAAGAVSYSSAPPDPLTVSQQQIAPPQQPPAPSPAAAAPTSSSSNTARTATQAQTQEQPQQPASTSADPSLKKLRGPILHRPSAGPSLLSQALASARGIPPAAGGSPTLSSSQQQQTTDPNLAQVRAHISGGGTSSGQPAPNEERSPKLPAQTTTTSTTPRPRASSRSSSSSTTAAANNNPKDVRSDPPSPSGGGEPLTPARASPLASTTMAPSAVMTATTTTTTTTIPFSPNKSNLAPSFETIEYGTTDLKQRPHLGLLPHNSSGKAPPTDAGSGKDAAPIYRAPRSSGPSPRTTSGNELPLTSPTSRPQLPEHRMSLGPEKIWSIGSSESDNNLDGQVEKSVAEVLAGVEHNTRSRKASHSLRFFKEGLPEKTKRRDSKHPGHVRELVLSPTLEAASQSHPVLDDNDSHANLQQSPRQIGTPLLQGEQPSRTPPVDAATAPQDYFGIPESTEEDDKEKTPRLTSAAGSTRPTSVCLDDYSILPEPAIAIAEQDSQAERRLSGSSTEGADSGEDGDDSGEEKISSAVFVPHQSPQEQKATAPLTPSTLHLQRAPTLHRGPSRGGDWLVKADEPEADRPDDNDEEDEQPCQVGGDGAVQTSDVPPLDKEQQLLKSSATAVKDFAEVKDDDLRQGQQPAKKHASADQLSQQQQQQQDEQGAVQQLSRLHEAQTFPLPLSTQQPEEGSLEQVADPQPLEAIQLLPYKHQVGGHTTLWRFSKRAVCKQLNNRENEFYERIERDVRDLLAFLPRYIGVLNVTFEKQPRRKSTLKREGAAGTEGRILDQAALRETTGSGGSTSGKTPHQADDEGLSNDAPSPKAVAGTGAEGSGAEAAAAGAAKGDAGGTPRHRVISQSLQSSQIPVPTVTFLDNQHILPRHLLQPSPKPFLLSGMGVASGGAFGGAGTETGGGPGGGGLAAGVGIPGRSGSRSFSAHPTTDKEREEGDALRKSILTRPSLEHHHANSWGATTVNKRLRNEVFNDVFLKHPIPIRPNRRSQHHSHRSSLPRSFLRPSTSDTRIPHTSAGTPVDQSPVMGHIRTESEPNQPRPRSQPRADVGGGEAPRDIVASRPASELTRRISSFSDMGPDLGSSSCFQPSKLRDGGEYAADDDDEAAAEEKFRGRRPPSRDGDGQEVRDDDGGDVSPKDVTGTSAPEPEIPGQKLAASLGGRRRRYSGTALRRKPKDVSGPRGGLGYFQEPDDDGGVESRRGSRDDLLSAVGNDDAGVKQEADQQFTSAGNEEQAEPMDIVGGGSIISTASVYSNYPSAATSGTTSPSAEFKRIPRPINPKEALMQRDSRREYFLLIEDLTAGMKRPCVMDLKMGTRQYGVEAGAKKQKSQRRKCAETTSRSLGVRVCGLQVWDRATQSYIFKDKYYGRNIKAGNEFQAALTRFLYDGVDRHSILRHIPTVLQKLRQLEVIIRRLDGYRFYAASLLMFYDGDQGETTPTGHENGGGGMDVYDSTTDFATDTEEAAAHAITMSKRKKKREIDFKMADFANCVTPTRIVDISPSAEGEGEGAKKHGPPCPPQHPDQPDRGFVRGLRSLQRYFLQIQRDTREELGLVSLSTRGAAGAGELEGELFGDDDDDFDEGSVSE